MLTAPSELSGPALTVRVCGRNCPDASRDAQGSDGGHAVSYKAIYAYAWDVADIGVGAAVEWGRGLV